MLNLPMAKPTASADTILLSRTRVATPCRADWNAMIGDNRSRFCGSCRKNVYNLSAMTQTEAANLIREKEGKLCVRYFERADGTVMTQDCPVGVATLKRKVARVFAASVVGFAALFSAATQWWTTDKGTNLFADRLHEWAERVYPMPSATPKPEPVYTVGMMPAPEPSPTPTATLGAPAMMGDVAPEVMGKMVVVREVKGKPRIER